MKCFNNKRLSVIGGILLLYFTQAIAVETATNPSNSTIELPNPTLAPTWFLAKALDSKQVGLHDLILENNNIFLGTGEADKVTIKNVDIKNGKIMAWPENTKQAGIYLGLGLNSANYGTPYLICRQCNVTDPTSKASFKYDGIVFAKPDVSFVDVAKTLKPKDIPTTYVFDDETKLSVKSVNFGTLNYSDPRYLQFLGYGDYINLPIYTSLYEKAKAGDTKAQFIYGLYWREVAGLDPSGDAETHFKNIMQALSTKNNDAKLWLANIYKAGNKPKEAVTFYDELIKANNHPMAAYKLGMIYANGETDNKDLVKACQLFEQATKGGLDLAQYDWGYCLYNGEAGKTDKNQGEHYMALAAANNVFYGTSRYNDCEVTMPKIENNTLVFKACPERNP
jgi:hypothetical protein